MPNDTMQTVLDAELQLVDVVTEHATDPYVYGADLYCWSDIDEIASDVTGIDLLAQDIFHRLSTPRGRLIDDRDYGIGVLEMLNKPVTRQELAALEGQITNEILKDDRLLSVGVNVVVIGNSASIHIFATPLDPAVNSFSLTFTASDGEFVLKEISRGV